MEIEDLIAEAVVRKLVAAGLAVKIGEPAINKPVLYTAQKAAEILGVSAEWLYREARFDRIPYQKLGRKRVRWTEQDLREIGQRPKKKTS